MNFYPLKFYPIFKEKIWGGRNLKSYLNKEIPDGQKIGESWELTCRDKDDISIIKNGVYKDLKLSNLIEKYKEELIGKAKMPKGKFPLLFKFIDAQDELSVQVHPQDDYKGLENRGELGKTECWFIINAEENAELTLGIKGILTPHELIEIIEKGQIEKYLNRIPVNSGDFIFLPAGIIHSIGRGILLAEIQENSDVTYRLWDWGRKDSNGKSRGIHIEQAIDVLSIKQDINSLVIRNNLHNRENDNNVIKVLTNNNFFNIMLYNINENIVLEMREKFKVLSIIQGEGMIVVENADEPIEKGDTVLLPAGLIKIELRPYNRLIFLETTPN